MVSHGHVRAVRSLLAQLARLLDPDRFEILLTLNAGEDPSAFQGLWPGRLVVVRNPRARGFGANHNAALRQGRGRWVAALDPDLQLSASPFDALASALVAPDCGVVAPPVLDPDGTPADHARPVPTPSRLLGRHLRQRKAQAESVSEPRQVDWIAGLFMAMRCETFERLGGFDERFHMYCEDVDLCLRSWHLGLAVRVVPAVPVIHPAQRRSLRHPRHFLWHCHSLMRLWRSPSYRNFRR